MLCACSARTSGFAGTSPTLSIPSNLVTVRMTPESPVQLGKTVSLARPSAIGVPRPPSAAHSASAVGGIELNGADFNADGPRNRATVIGTNVRLLPGATGAAGLAFCTYAFDASRVAAPTVALSWLADSAPDTAKTYVGLSNWTNDRWDWYQGDADGVITLPGWTDYRRDSGSTLLTVLVMGDVAGILQQVTLGQPEQRGTGLVVPPGQVTTPVPPLFYPSTDLPTQYDLAPGCAPVSDQGGWASCTAFAVVDGAYSYMVHDLYGRLGWDLTQPQFRLSAKYNYVRSGYRYNYPANPSFGRSVTEAANSLRLDGVALAVNAPYDWSYSNLWSLAAKADAAALKADTLTCVASYWDSGRATVKDLLANGHQPVVACFGFDDAFAKYEPGSVYHYGGPTTLMHTVCIVGYDDALQAYKVRNSWGTAWGNNGYCWLGYDVLDSVANQGCFVLSDSFSPTAVAHFLPEALQLPAPAGVRASQGTLTNGVELDWQPVVGATSYRVYRDAPDNLLGTADVPSFHDLQAGRTYSHMYWVRACTDTEQGVTGSMVIGYTGRAMAGQLNASPAPAVAR